MIIVMTNRKLSDVPVNEPKIIDVEKMGVVLAERHANEDVLFSGVLSSDQKRIKFYPKQSTRDIFSSISAADRAKPWVFFVHGFHQDPEENIKKANQLSRRHNVNVIAFAWPSRPLDEDMNMDDVKAIVKDDVISSVLGGATLAKIGVHWVYKSLRDTWVNYEPALRNAENSKIDLLSAMNQVNDYLPSESPSVLLVHSMGNYLLENVINDVDELPIKFCNIILHQADVDSHGHRWVKKLRENLTDKAKLYITTNAYDTTLAGSQIHKKINGEEHTERLGQTRNHFVLGDINYLDFTDGVYVSDDHEFFKRGKEDTDPDIYNCLRRLFRAEPDLLPEVNEESNAGFTKMPTDVQLYRLENVIHPADTDFDPENDQTVSSLGLFDDTFFEKQ